MVLALLKSRYGSTAFNTPIRVQYVWMEFLRIYGFIVSIFQSLVDVLVQFRVLFFIDRSIDNVSCPSNALIKLINPNDKVAEMSEHREADLAISYGGDVT